MEGLDTSDLVFPYLRENTRSIEELEKINIISHPLMLTQLLVAYHMVKASLGHHAI